MVIRIVAILLVMLMMTYTGWILRYQYFNNGFLRVDRLRGVTEVLRDGEWQPASVKRLHSFEEIEHP